MNRTFFSYYALLLILLPLHIESMNLLRPYDTLIRPDPRGDYPFRVTFFAERGIGNATGYNGDGAIVNPLRIWQPAQNCLRMLCNQPQGCAANTLFNQLGIVDDGRCGTCGLNGNLKLDWSVAGSFSYWWSPSLWFAIYMPVYSMRLSNICINDLTPSNTPAGVQARCSLTNNIPQLCEALSNGSLCLDSWRRKGFGDTVLMVEWLTEHPQARLVLKNVMLNGRIGVVVPSGHERNEDKLFALPFGTDGGWGLVFGGGLGVTLGCYLDAGFDVQLTHVFGTVRNRRIRTDVGQTDLLLLNKVSAYNDVGLTQRFNLFFKIHDIFPGAWLQAGYQFLKHGRDHLTLLTCNNSNEVANCAVNLHEWIAHQVIVSAGYNATARMGDDACAVPQFSLFARIPFNGKRSALFTTIGGYFAIDF